MSWAHSEVVRVRTNGALRPYPCLDRVTDLRFASVANGGECETAAPDVAYYTLAGALLPFELERHDLTTGEIVYHVGVPPTAAAYLRRWGDASVTVSLANPIPVWADYVSPPIGADAGTQGFVAHCADNAANGTVTNSCGSGTGDGIFSADAPTSARTTAASIGAGFALSGSGDDIIYTPKIIHLGIATTHLEVSVRFTLAAYPVAAAVFVGTQYFSLSGYAFYVNPTGHLVLAGFNNGAGPILTGATTLSLGVAYCATGKIANGIGSIYLGLDGEDELASLDASGPLNAPAEVESAETAIGGMGSNVYMFTGTIDEVRITLNDLPLQTIPDFLIAYEDPCAIRSPIVVSILKTILQEVGQPPFEYLVAATAPLRDHGYLGSAFKAPRLLSGGPWVKAASQWLTGSFEAQTAPVRLADTDHVVRAFLDRHGGSSLASERSDYLLSAAQRGVGGDPRLIFQGRIDTDILGESLTVTLPGRDILGSAYNLLQSETMIPQRLIETDFPGFGLSHLDGSHPTALAVPIIGGTHSDEDATVPGGRVPVIYVGQKMCLDSVLRHCGLVSGHANDGGVINLYDNTSPTPVAVTWGTTAWGPGQTGWAAVNPDGAALYTIVGGRTYTLVFFDDTLGAAFADGSKSFFVNTHGFCVNGDGTGGEVTGLLDQFLLAFENFFLPTPDWQAGDWFDETTTQFEFSPDGVLIDRLEAASWPRAKAIWLASYSTTGVDLAGHWVLGANGAQQALRTVLAQFCVQSHTSLGVNRYMQYFVAMLDLDADHHVADRKVTHKDTLSRAPLQAPLVPELLIDHLFASGNFNYRTNAWDRVGELGNAPSTILYLRRDRDEAYTLISDVGGSGFDLGAARLAFCATPRRLVKWQESLCGLSSDVLDVIKLTHFNGLGALGFQDRQIWIQRQTLQPDGTVECEGYDVDDLITVGAVDRAIRSGADEGMGLDLGAPDQPALS